MSVIEYTEVIDIEKPRDAIVALFDDPHAMLKWQYGLVSMIRISGTPGHRGARTKLRFKLPSGETEMFETLEEVDLPDRMVNLYESPGMWNRNTSTFEPLGDRTRWTLVSTFRPDPELAALYTERTIEQFKAQTRRNMKSFKDFAERQ